MINQLNLTIKLKRANHLQLIKILKQTTRLRLEVEDVRFFRASPF
jgi:hypothetical protein